MPSSTKLLLTGVTGYIGGSVLVQLLKQPDFAKYEITALLRSAEKAEKLKKLGINAVVGSHEDEQLVESLASEADIVIATANADSVPAARATLAGLKRRYASTGIAPIFINTSGVAVFADNSNGDSATDVIWNDADSAQIETLPDTAVHRNVDLMLVNADKEGYVKAYILLPSSVYGQPSGDLVKQGIQNPHSLLIPGLASAAVGAGHSGTIGLGKNIWNNVHIDDLADLYIVLLKSIKENPSTGHGRDGYYVGENGEHTIEEVSQAIGKALFELGKVKTAKTSPFTKEELDKTLGPYAFFFGVNARSSGKRSKSLGWKPRYTKDDLLANVKSDIEVMIKTGRL